VLPTFTRLRSTPAERSVFVRIAAALCVVAFGAGITMSAWAHSVATSDYAPRPELVELLDRYLRGEPTAVAFVVVFGPLVEEVIARGLLLMGLLRLYHPYVAVALSALAFGALHLNLVQFMPGVLLGLVLGSVYARTGSLGLCWLGHAAYNAQWLANTVFRLPLAGYAPLPPVGAEGDQPTAWLIFGAVMLVGGLVWLGHALGTVPHLARPSWRGRQVPDDRGAVGSVRTVAG
jgi:membrane protease YdiL (CAAX protease family)